MYKGNHSDTYWLQIITTHERASLSDPFCAFYEPLSSTCKIGKYSDKNKKNGWLELFCILINADLATHAI